MTHDVWLFLTLTLLNWWLTIRSPSWRFGNHPVTRLTFFHEEIEYIDTIGKWVHGQMITSLSLIKSSQQADAKQNRIICVLTASKSASSAALCKMWGLNLWLNNCKPVGLGILHRVLTHQTHRIFCCMFATTSTTKFRKALRRNTSDAISLDNGIRKKHPKQHPTTTGVVGFPPLDFRDVNLCFFLSHKASTDQLPIVRCSKGTSMVFWAHGRTLKTLDSTECRPQITNHPHPYPSNIHHKHSTRAIVQATMYHEICPQILRNFTSGYMDIMMMGFSPLMLILSAHLQGAKKRSTVTGALTIGACWQICPKVPRKTRSWVTTPRDDFESLPSLKPVLRYEILVHRIPEYSK